MNTTSVRAENTSSYVDEHALDAFHQRHPKRRSNRHFWTLAFLIEVALLLVVWEVAVSQFQLIRPAFLPPPSQIIVALIEVLSRRTFLDHFFYSLTSLVIGVTLASALGVTIGVAVGWFRFLELTIAPLLWILYSVPKVALAPLIILGLGLEIPSKVFLVVLLGFFPIALNAIEGVKTADASLIRAARVFGASGFGLLGVVVLPSTLPFVLVGLRRAVALGFIGVMLGEFLGGGRGIGYLLQRAVFEFHMDDALAIVVIFIAFANASLALVTLGQKRFAPWAN